MMPVPAGAERSTTLPEAVTAFAVVMQRAGVAERHAEQIAARGLGGLADRFRHFARLAVAEADAALEVADDDERGEAEALTALHDLGDAVDVDELVREFAVALFPIPLPSASASVWSTCHD